MDRPRGEYEYTDVESGGETRWNDYPSKGPCWRKKLKLVEEGSQEEVVL